ncbi:multiubiquitin domain-containing protein [Noviherbaspirillum sp.]|jgi:hypothetical protein|uniref:multiubiquitin domain-containing protein n=1 Tax=Noviherbaspirillum sp. TaxID=1926288 RepID=UPI0025FCFF50|nr:multiubiquitin domain-containing protein [Noviherbaspirillum sp.]
MNAEVQHIEEVIDLETYAKAKKPVPPGKRYQIKIDKQQYVAPAPTMTGREILTLAGKVPVEKFILQQKNGSHVHRVGLEDVVDFTQPGIERFMTIPNEVTEGEGRQLRRDFDLLPDDKAYLEGLGLPWETVLDTTAKVRRVVIHDFPIPTKYNTTAASVNIRFESGYPDVQIDMAYFYPHLARTDGKGINNLSTDQFDGRIWQRWSRHRTGASAWRIGVDNLETHMALVSDWLQAELNK